MYTASFLQSIVAPICTYSQTDDAFYVQQLFGTGFFFNVAGFFLTARHVIEDGMHNADKSGHRLGIFPMVDNPKRSLTAPILEFDFADNPFDIAICKTDYRVNTWLKLERREVEVWQDVATMGYPISVVNQAVTEYQIQQRAHKGYIQRVIPKGRLHLGNHPDAFELSFPITHGLSGSPLFVYMQSYDAVIGICVGSHKSRVVDYETIIYQDENFESKESSVRVEEFGIAHDVRSLLDWKPTCLRGKSLLEASA
jgi:S1-C subfamily serine protease